MKTISRIVSRYSRIIACISMSALAVSAQPAAADSGSGSSIFIYLIIAALLFGAAFFLWKRSSKGEKASQYDYSNRVRGSSSSDNSDTEGVDAEKELEWFRKAKRSNAPVEKAEQFKERRSPKRRAMEAAKAPVGEDLESTARIFQEKMRKIQYAQLPVNSFIQLTEARPFEHLPLSADPALLNAIEQTQDEFEDDESVRELAVRILAAFRHRNSVEALSQVALYDLSANVRSKAVNILAGFDHESVFESILLACADPTREVRAAAARGLFKLNFDRAEAWKRIIGTGDKFRMSHAARAAIEAGIVTKSFDRLLHDDMKVAYEAFVLTALVIRSGETDGLFAAIATGGDQRVKYALLHVISVVADPTALEALRNLDTSKVSEDVATRIKEVVEQTEPIMA